MKVLLQMRDNEAKLEKARAYDKATITQYFTYFSFLNFKCIIPIRIQQELENREKELLVENYVGSQKKKRVWSGYPAN